MRRDKGIWIRSDFKSVLYNSKMDFVWWTLRLPFVVLFCFMAFPFFIVWVVLVGIEGFFKTSKEFFIGQEVYLIPIMPFVAIYQMLSYKKVRRTNKTKGS